MKINQKEVSSHKRSINIIPKEDPTTLTTHPTTSHNIKLTKRENVHDCLKNNCVYTRLLAKNPRMYATFGQKSAYVRDFWPKTCLYREGNGKKQAKDQTNKGECQWMNML